MANTSSQGAPGRSKPKGGKRAPKQDSVAPFNAQASQSDESDDGLFSRSQVHCGNGEDVSLFPAYQPAMVRAQELVDDSIQQIQRYLESPGASLLPPIIGQPARSIATNAESEATHYRVALVGDTGNGLASFIYTATCDSNRFSRQEFFGEHDHRCAAGSACGKSSLICPLCSGHLTERTGINCRQLHIGRVRVHEGLFEPNVPLGRTGPVHGRRQDR